MPHFNMMNGEEAFRQSLTWSIHGCYVVRSALHKTYPYDESQRGYSDDNTTRIPYYYSRKVVLCDGVYYYRQQAASVKHQASVHRFDFLLANESMRRQLVDIGASDDDLHCYETVRWLIWSESISSIIFTAGNSPQQTTGRGGKSCVMSGRLST